MPPKKAAAVTTLVGEYDVELMNKNELKMYVKALEEEHERMRKIRNLYQKDNSELKNFLISIQDEATHNKKIGMQKNIELQDQLLEQEKELKFEDELVKAMEIENNNEAEKDTFESYIKLITKKLQNKQEESELLKDINEKDREIKHMQYIYELISTESKESYFSEYEERSKTFNNSFKNIVTENHKNLLENFEKFSQNKIENLQAILGENNSIGEENQFSNEIAKMTDYFKDIFWKNIKTMDELQSTIALLERDLKYITRSVSKVKKENAELYYENQFRSSSRSLISLDPSFSILKLKKLEELTYENYLLNIKLEMLKKEYSELKRKCVSALRRIYQAADFKALLLEKKLSALQNYPRRFD